MDALLCFPPLLLAVALVGPGVATLIPVLAFIFVPGFTSVAYSGMLSVRAQDYVEAVRALGAPPGRIMLKTILPNLAGPLLVQFGLVVATAIALESGLSFLGLDVVPPTPSWDLMIGAARATMNQRPLLLLSPCIALTVTILIMNSFCDGLRDMFDPSPVPARWIVGAASRTASNDAAQGSADAPLLAITDLTLSISEGDGAFAPVRNLDLTLRAGETLAIANDPILLIADEPTTALDVTIQARVLDLLADLKKSRGLAMIFISHSLPVVADIADRVIVMYAGEMVEEGPAKEVFARPRHPYTAALIACAPNESGAPPRPIDGVVPSPTDLPTGCVFAPRCGMRIAACEAARPTLIEIALDRRSRCLRWSEL